MTRAAVNHLGYIDTLTDAERRAVFDRLAYQFADKPKEFTRQEQDTWTALCAAVGYHASLEKFIKSYGRKNYSDACAAIVAYVDSGCRGAPSVTLRNALTKSVLVCLVDWYKEYGHGQATHKCVLDKIPVLGLAVEECFPGYLAAGLLPRIAPMAIAA
jgi:hypothetical protein